MATFNQTMSGDSRYSVSLTVTEVLPSDYLTTNKSNVNYVLTATKSSGGGYWDNSAENPIKVIINGSTVVDRNITYDFRGSTPKSIILANGTVEGILHNDDGTKTINVSGSFTDGGNSLGSATASGQLELTTIPRKTSITSFTVAKRDETSLTFGWSTSDTVDYVWYSTNNGSSWTGYDVTDDTSGGFVVDGLNPNTTYNCKIRVRRKDSQLTTDSNTVSQTTNAYPQFTTQPTYSGRTETTLDVYYKQNMYISLAQYRIRTSSGNYGNWENINGNNVISGNPINGTGCTFRISGLFANTNYVVQVRLKSALSDNYTYSNEVSTNMYTYAYPYITAREIANLTIGNSQKVTLYNPLGRTVTIKMNQNNTDGVELYSGTTSSTSLQFTPAKATLYASIPNSTSGNCVYSVIYGNVVTTLSGTYIINVNECKPTFSDFAYSTNLSELTGNNATIVNGETTTTFIISTTNKATGNYSATITKYRYKCGSQSNEVAYSNSQITVTLPKCDNQNIEITAIDSRGLETTVQKTVTNYKAYSKPSFRNITADRNDGVEATTKLNFRLNYWNDSFGNVTNSIVYVAYRSKLTTASDYGSYTLIPVSELTLNNGVATLSDYLIHANGTSGGFEVGKAYNVQVIISDGATNNYIETIYGYPNITDGNVAFSTFQDNSGQYHMGFNGMPDTTKTATVHGNTKLDGQLELSYTSDIYWKEDGWGDKFDIVPQFGGSGDDNKLLIRGAVGDVGTDPDLYTLATISAQTGYTWFKGHVETSERFIIPKADGKGIYNSSGYPIIRDFNNGNITVDGTGNALYLGFQNTNEINILADRAWVRSDGSFQSPAGFYSYDAGYVNTPTNTGKLLIKKAHYNPDGTPNNGVVLQYGEYNEWNGQLFIGDNYEQGVWYNGWSNGVRGTWKKLAFEDNETFALTADSNVTTVYDALIGKKNGNTIHLYGTFELNSYAWGTKIANSKYKPSIGLRFIVSCSSGYACLYIDTVGDIYYLYGDNGSVFLNTTFVV